MKTYHTIKHESEEYHYRVTGNSYGWNIYVINSAMLDPKLCYTAGKEVKSPFWEQPIDKAERKKYLESMALELALKYL